jgi:hypothetical protein
MERAAFSYPEPRMVHIVKPDHPTEGTNDCVGGWVRHQHRPQPGDTNNNLSTRHHHSDHNSTKTPNSILSLIGFTHTHSQHSTHWLTRLAEQELIIRGKVWWQPARWWEIPPCNPKSTITVLSPTTLCPHGIGLRTTRKINPVQILQWIGQPAHCDTSPDVEGVTGPTGNSANTVSNRQASV